MRFRLALSKSAVADMRALRAFDRQRVAAAIETQLLTQPLSEARNRKPLRVEEWVLPFEHVPPVWELRVGQVRVYYDVDEEASVVNVASRADEAAPQDNEGVIDMRTVAIVRPSGELKDLLHASRRGRVLVKQNGRPVAVVVDVRGKDEEQIQLENDPEFWRMIQERRGEPTVPWEQVKAELRLEQPRKHKPATKVSRHKRKAKGNRNATA